MEIRKFCYSSYLFLLQARDIIQTRNQRRITLKKDPKAPKDKKLEKKEIPRKKYPPFIYR